LGNPSPGDQEEYLYKIEKNKKRRRNCGQMQTARKGSREDFAKGGTRKRAPCISVWKGEERRVRKRRPKKKSRERRREKKERRSPRESGKKTMQKADKIGKPPKKKKLLKRGARRADWQKALFSKTKIIARGVSKNPLKKKPKNEKKKNRKQ